MNKTLVIAEPGGTHEGKLYVMRELVAVAAQCGAGCFKSQWTSNAQAMCDRRHAQDYLPDYLKLQYPLEWHAELRDLAKELGMSYACSIYIPGDAERIAPLVDYIKIASFEYEDRVFVKECRKAARKKRVKLIASAGMCGVWPKGIYGPDHRLWCISAYPAPLGQLCLAQLQHTNEYEFPECDGFSDHSHDVRVGAWAVAAGASVLETHFRLDECDPANKDYEVAFTPAEFTEYVRNVRDCELAMGDGVKRIMDAEQPMLRYRVTT